MVNLVCWGDGDIPAFIELADGNQADKKRFAELNVGKMETKLSRSRSRLWEG